MSKTIGILSRYCLSFIALLVSMGVVTSALMGKSPDAGLVVKGNVESYLPTILLDAGHGGEDCGAIGVNGIYEKDINLAITRGVADLLRQAGYHVVETRTTDVLLYDPLTVQKGQKKNTDLYNRLHISKSYEKAIFISVHMNSFPASPRQKGAQIWYSDSDKFSLEMAKILNKYIVDEFHLCQGRSLMKTNGKLYLLDRAIHPSVLLECGFLSNEEECRKLSDENYQKELSFAIFCAMIEIINLYGEQA